MKSFAPGPIEINGKKVKTSSLSSYAKARQVAETLKKQIVKGRVLAHPGGGGIAQRTGS